jgi:hypothetical protein
MAAVCVVFGAHRERELLHAGEEDAALVVGYLKLWRGVDDGRGRVGGSHAWEEHAVAYKYTR